ncbi:MAG: hypothetical protein QOJ07_1468, partial [Thermoleophilaceae bacterium]|nr:hypothetical protein [Thermoleophilaceae bacterium]
IEGVELLAHVLHPDLVPDPPPEARAIVLDLSRSALRG